MTNLGTQAGSDGIRGRIRPGGLKEVKVYIAAKRKLGVGDIRWPVATATKASLPKSSQDKLYLLADGTPVDIVLNPLGVPSRMNVGQVLEAPTLGIATWGPWLQVATPVFDGISEETIWNCMSSQKEVDGFTGSVATRTAPWEEEYPL